MVGPAALSARRGVVLRAHLRGEQSAAGRLAHPGRHQAGFLTPAVLRAGSLAMVGPSGAGWEQKRQAAPRRIGVRWTVTRPLMIMMLFDGAVGALDRVLSVWGRAAGGVRCAFGLRGRPEHRWRLLRCWSS